jgi:hypothetical protein
MSACRLNLCVWTAFIREAHFTQDSLFSLRKRTYSWLILSRVRVTLDGVLDWTLIRN